MPSRLRSLCSFVVGGALAACVPRAAAAQAVQRYRAVEINGRPLPARVAVDFMGTQLTTTFYALEYVFQTGGTLKVSSTMKQVAQPPREPAYEAIPRMTMDSDGRYERKGVQVRLALGGATSGGPADVWPVTGTVSADGETMKLSHEGMVVTLRRVRAP